MIEKKEFDMWKNATMAELNDKQRKTLERTCIFIGE